MVSLKIWRSRVGTFRRSIVTPRKFCKSWKRESLLFLFFVVTSACILQILVVGNIELNPGPVMYTCHYCSYITHNIKSLLNHQKLHATDSNFTYKCPSETCHHTFKSYDAARRHVERFHYEASPESSSTTCTTGSTGWSCSVQECVVSFPSVKSLSQHMVSHLKTGLPILCPLRGCKHKALFVSVANFRSHLSIYHKDWKTVDSVTSSVADPFSASDCSSATSKFQCA